MRVLMLGWEFPPLISGGLGTACHGLTKALSRMGTHVIFALPRPVESCHTAHVQLVGPGSRAMASPALPAGAHPRGDVELRPVDAALSPYARPGLRSEPVRSTNPGGVAHGTGACPGAKRHGPREDARDEDAHGHYGGSLWAEIGRYADAVRGIAREEVFDIIHAHDWMTFPAGIAAARLSGKPLVVHVHSTEFDRSGDHVNQGVYETERRGMHEADRVIAVSHLTKRLCAERYGVPEGKVSVVHNAVERRGRHNGGKAEKAEKVVLFLGRITMQKGPEYFLAAARRVLEKVPHVKFIMAGAGDQRHRMVELAAEMGIGHRVLFAGFLRGEEVSRAFHMADLYVMPSVSEPFGIAPLEALDHDVPVIVSKQSGVSEVLTHVLKVDFWDINEMANKIIAVLTRPALRHTLRQNGSHEVKKFDWATPARLCLDIYGAAGVAREVLNRRGPECHGFVSLAAAAS